MIQFVPSPDGPQADVALIEPNDDEHLVRCLLRRGAGIEIGGDRDTLTYLTQRYGDEMVSLTAQGIVLGISV